MDPNPAAFFMITGSVENSYEVANISSEAAGISYRCICYLASTQFYQYPLASNHYTNNRQPATKSPINYIPEAAPGSGPMF